LIELTKKAVKVKKSWFFGKSLQISERWAKYGGRGRI